METDNHNNPPICRRRQRNSFKRELSTSDCIFQLLYYFTRLLFKGLCTRNKKSIEGVLMTFCFPIIYLLRVVNAIKWRRILNPRRLANGLRKCFTKFRTLKIMKLYNRFHILKRGRRESDYVGKVSYRMDIDIRNV